VCKIVLFRVVIILFVVVRVVMIVDIYYINIVSVASVYISPQFEPSVA
jgi:hypothetical protein